MTQAMALDDSANWHGDAVATIIGLSLKEPEFTADDLRREMRPAPHQFAAGQAFAAAKNAGHIEAINSTVSKSKSRNFGSLKTWTRKTTKEQSA